MRVSLTSYVVCFTNVLPVQMLGEIFLSVCLFEKSRRTVINHVIVGPRYVIEYECLFNETRVQ